MSNHTQTKKKYYPSKRNYNNYPKKYNNSNHNNNNPPNIFGGFFNGNLANNMRFGHKDHALSGFVKREIYIRDQYGNVQRAKETQFFNSGPNIGMVSIRHKDGNNENKFKK